MCKCATRTCFSYGFRAGGSAIKMTCLLSFGVEWQGIDCDAYDGAMQDMCCSVIGEGAVFC